MSARTPVAGLFVYHIFGLPRELPAWGRDPSSYALEVTGLVARPERLTLERLRTGFPPVVLETVLQCMTNVHWGRVEVRGARLLDLLETAGRRRGRSACAAPKVSRPTCSSKRSGGNRTGSCWPTR